MMARDSNHNTFTDDTHSQDKLRLVLDTMDNKFALQYDAHPDRIIVVESGRVAFMCKEVRQQLKKPDKLMTDEVEVWLEKRFSQE